MSEHIDLHVHSTASDGTMSPEQLVKYAKDKGLSAIAITDHDTVAGIPEAIKAGNTQNIEIVPGVELSCNFDEELHMLGLYIDYKSSKLLEMFEQLRENRNKRNLKIINQLNELGVDINSDEVEDAAQGESIGRLHIAETMVNKGYAKDTEQAFRNYLADGKIAYVKRDSIVSPHEAIKLIKSADGIPILAHPGHLNRSMQEIQQLILELKNTGLEGIEVYHSDHSKEMSEFLLEIAKNHNLFITGGSDFHGTHKESVEIGSGRDNLKIEYELLEKIKKYKKFV